MRLFLILLVVPLIEIGLFIEVGGWLGLWPTLAIVVATAVAGTLLLRTQGALVLQKLAGSVSAGQDPSHALVHGLMIFVAALLLLTPGFFTDAIGLAFLFPKTREIIIREFGRKMAGKAAVYASQTRWSRSSEDDKVVEGRSVVIDTTKREQ